MLTKAGMACDLIADMDDINPEFKTCDVSIVIGANDVVNPTAKTDKSSPIYGTPILNVVDSRQTIVIKRGKGTGWTTPGFSDGLIGRRGIAAGQKLPPCQHDSARPTARQLGGSGLCVSPSAPLALPLAKTSPVPARIHATCGSAAQRQRIARVPVAGYSGCPSLCSSNVDR